MKNTSSQAGFSLAELLVVIAVLVILACFAILGLGNVSKHTADDQARKAMDVLDEARQKALNQRKTFRVEINKTRNQIRLIDEGSNITTANDDVVLKTYQISNQVVIGSPPANSFNPPTATSPIAVPSYVTSGYPLSSGDQKITLRFKRDGQVVDAGTDDIGTGSQPSGALIYFYPKSPSGTPDVLRAVMVLGTTGDTSLYKCKFLGVNCTNWSR